MPAPTSQNSVAGRNAIPTLLPQNEPEQYDEPDNPVAHLLHLHNRRGGDRPRAESPRAEARLAAEAGEARGADVDVRMLRRHIRGYV